MLLYSDSESTESQEQEVPMRDARPPRAAAPDAAPPDARGPPAHSFESLCLPFLDEMRSYARALTKDAAWADDLVQDAMIRAWQGWTRFTPDPALGTPRDATRAWLYKIVTHTFRNQIESRDRITRFDTAYAEQEEGALQSQFGKRDLGDASVDAYRTPREAVRVVRDAPPCIDIGDEILLAISRLAPEHRAVVELHYLEGLTLTQIAERLGMPRKTAGTRLYRARPMLKAALQGYARAAYRIEWQARRRGRATPVAI